MKVSYSELPLLGNPVLKNIELLIASGADSVELMMDATPWDTVDGNWKKLAKEIKERNFGVPFTVHPPAWDTNLVSQMAELREATWKLHVDSLEFAAQIGAKQVVLHPGFYGSPAFDKKEAQQRAMELTAKIADIAKSLGLKLAFENVGYHGQSLFTADEYACALNGIDETVGYLIDVGHANINGWDVPALIRRVAPRLCGLHIHDNNGNSDQHLPIGDGTMEWNSIYEAMGEVPAACEFILEYTPGTPMKRLTEGKRLLQENVFVRHSAE